MSEIQQLNTPLMFTLTVTTKPPDANAAQTPLKQRDNVLSFGDSRNAETINQGATRSDVESARIAEAEAEAEKDVVRTDVFEQQKTEKDGSNNSNDQRGFHQGNSGQQDSNHNSNQNYPDDAGEFLEEKKEDLISSLITDSVPFQAAAIWISTSPSTLTTPAQISKKTLESSKFRESQDEMAAVRYRLQQEQERDKQLYLIGLKRVLLLIILVWVSVAIWWFGSNDFDTSHLQYQATDSTAKGNSRK